MRMFVSSLIGGMEPIRQVVRETVEAFRHQPIMAEDFGARPESPQVACLTELRGSDVVILILGDRYGAVQASGLSATHEEYREAKDTKPVIALIQEGVERDERQAAFVAEVQTWEGGLLRDPFRTVDDLRKVLTRALSDYALALAAGPVDQDALAVRATALLPPDQRHQMGGPILGVAVAGSPRQRLLRPIELEDKTLADDLHKATLFGPTRIFDPAEGVQTSLEDAALLLHQKGGASVRLEEDGSILIQLPADNRSEPAHRGLGFSGMMLVEETVQQRLTAALAFSAWALERIDPTQKLTHLAVACRLLGAEHRSWVSQADADRIAASGSMQMGISQNEPGPVSVTLRRAALNLDTARVVEDLIVPLRRHWRR